LTRELIMLEKLEKELNLKQLQIRSLLTITQAINDNVPQDGLFNMYKSFLSWEMGIEKMVLFIMADEGWICTTHINYENDKVEDVVPLITSHKRLYTIKSDDPEPLRDFDIIIPVFHKDQPIAYSLIGGIKDKDDLFNKIQFITTITNIIAVAIENKRLFRRQLEQEKYRTELLLAQDVQSMLIPDSLPSNDRYAISKIYKPHYNVGGDYIDYIKYDEDRFAICIADISGKGVAAALLMANFQAMVQSLIFQYKDLETFIFALNQAVYRITRADKFITFFVAEINLKTGKIHYVNAGHFPPILYRKSGVCERLTTGCSVIGAFDKLPEIKEGVLDLDGECYLLSFTDGLGELSNGKGDYFEEAHLIPFIAKNSAILPDEFNKRLLEEIEVFRGREEYLDDIAVLTCKIF
jgi:sigma-B regulation protein RsbU (phosphoserine phosphatase)